MAYEILKILEENGESVDVTFHITLDENGEYAFDTTDFTLDRFKADVYGQAKIDDLSKEEAKASAARMIEDLSQADRYGLVNKKEAIYGRRTKRVWTAGKFYKRRSFGYHQNSLCTCSKQFPEIHAGDNCYKCKRNNNGSNYGGKGSAPGSGYSGRLHSGL